MNSKAAVPVALALCLSSLWAQPPRPLDPAASVPASIVSLFDSHRIVMLGELHGSVQQHALLKQLVADPRFAERVNDIVVEGCNSFYQEAMDRYIAGSEVPRERLRLAWENVVGAPGGAPVPPYHGLFAAIRSVNLKLPRDRRLRVLCGDPPIDWTRVETREDIAPFLGFRDEHYASVVRYQVLALRRKALLIMGSGHFQRREGKPGLIEQQMIMAFVKPYVILPGSDIVGGYDDLDERFQQQPAPWLAEMKDHWVGALPRWQESPVVGYPAMTPTKTKLGTWAQTGDAYLYLGSRDKLTQGGEAFDLEGTPYGAELRRRWKIIFPKPPQELPKSDGQERPLFPKMAPPAPALPRVPSPN
ncbi:hypothetical protein [Paludibaculum fermentans]|uniref:hypothetical protein n=1 Tax=Paludibaculum fermentans TaxID=1473598 RepID=UPI003EC0E2CD